MMQSYEKQTVTVHNHLDDPDVAFDMYRAREAQGTLTFSYREFLRVYDAPVEAEIPSLGRRANAYIYNSFGMEAFRRTLDELLPKLSS
jgi:hypothetical protein